MKTLVMTAILGESGSATRPTLWQSAEPFEIAMLAAGALLTLGIVGVFVFVLTRKETK